jgi:hypothetical protein
MHETWCGGTLNRFAPHCKARSAAGFRIATATWRGELALRTKRPSREDFRPKPFAILPPIMKARLLLAAFLCTTSAQAFVEHKERMLGPTGLFGVTSPKDITIVKVDPGSPAEGLMKPGEVITAAGGIPFKDQTRKQLAAAIDLAEATGKLALTRKDGTIVEIPLSVLGTYADTAPYDCPKTDLIITRAADFIVKSKNFGRDGFPIALLGLLATGEPQYIDFVKQQVRQEKWAQPDINLSIEKYARTAWNWAYTGIFLGEYYLLTKDDFVLPALEAHTVALAKGRDAGGLWGHGFASLDLNNGQPHGRLPGYAQMNQTSLACYLAILLAEKSGIRHPDILATIEQNHTYFSNFIGRGTLPYGVHNPNAKAFNNNGMSGLAAITFAIKGDPAGAEFFSRMSAASHQTMEQGHTGHFFNLMWTAPGASLCGREVTSAFFRETQWLSIINRKWNGDFIFSSSESAKSGYGYSNLSDAGCHLLTHCLPRRALVITGRDADGALHLTGDAAKAAVALATLDVKSLTDAELLENFGHPMPKIRLESVWTLRGRQHALDPAIRKMIFDGTPDQRESAIGYYGYGCEKETALAAMPDLVKLLRDPAAPIDLRAAAAASLSNLGDDARAIFPDLLQLVRTEKPGDPLSRINETLGQALNTLAPDPFAAGLVTDKDLFYQAVDALLRHPRASGRSTGMKLIENMPVGDFHRMGREIAAILADQNRSYHSYHNLEPRNAALSIYANLGIEGGIDAAFAVLDEETGKAGFKIRMLMDVLPKYGAAAKPYLPKIREINAGKFTAPWQAMIQKIEAIPAAENKTITFDEAMKAGGR